jgi:[ribosomal protein S18]-alanine N-acetyltransferase
MSSKKYFNRKMIFIIFFYLFPSLICKYENTMTVINSCCIKHMLDHCMAMHIISTKRILIKKMITQVSNNDIHEISLLEERVFVHPWSKNIFYNELKNPYIKFYKYSHNSRLVGYALLLLLSDEAELHKIAIHPDFQKHGFGSSLLEFIESLALSSGALRIFLEVRETNHTARQFYSSHHYHTISARKDYYDIESAIIMEKHLT